VFLPILIQISDDKISIEARQEGRSTQDPSRKTMTPWTFDIKFPLDTQFTFGSLTFAMGEDRDLKMLPPRASARASCSGSFIYIGRCLFRFGSFCRVINSQCQARSVLLLLLAAARRNSGCSLIGDRRADLLHHAGSDWVGSNRLS
jgi:hypothetical protein